MLDFLREPKGALELPLDLRGTAFQQRVWRTLCGIPAGETRSYAQLAAMAGNPKAVRAVARSCATNPVALAVPCHRVVGSDGGLTGYRWGGRAETGAAGAGGKIGGGGLGGHGRARAASSSAAFLAASACCSAWTAPS